QRGGAYGRKQIYLVDNAEQALHYGAIEKQLCSGSTGEVYNYLHGMMDLGSILFNIAPQKRKNRVKGNPTGSGVQVPPNVKVIDGTRMELFNTRLFGGTSGLSADSLLTEGLARTSSENEARSLREHGFKARSIKVGDQYCVYAKYR
ncbi:MAG: hypothetical protein WC455_27425, partial [Dehalococcoidia bacterium]